MTTASDPTAIKAGPRPYDQLAEGVKAVVTYHEWLWMSDAQKASLERDMTTPDDYDLQP